MRPRSFAPVLLSLALAALPCRAGPLTPHPPAPRFKIRSIDGKTLDLEKLRQQGPVLLDFWATWCKPCLAAIPELQAIADELGPRGLTVIGISTDGPSNFSKVRPFARRLGIRYPVAIDEDGTLAQKYLVRGMPTSVLIDTSGAVVRVQMGFLPGESAALRQAIAQTLGAADSLAVDSTGTNPADSSGTERREP